MKTIPPLFHISFNKALPTFMYPRQPNGLHDPDNIETKVSASIFAEDLPPRISFSPSVAECFRAIWPNIHQYFTRHKYPYMDMYVYALVKGDHKCMYTPEFMTKENKLWDAHFTNEHCFLTKVKVKKVAKIRVMNPTISGYADIRGSITEYTTKDGIKVPLIHPYNNPDYEAVKGSPDPIIKVIRKYDDALPIIINPL